MTPGLFRVDHGSVVASETEQQVYEHLGLPWIPPTPREDRDEIDAAYAGELPDLATCGTSAGPAHPHESHRRRVHAGEMVAADSRGDEYYAITDHARTSPCSA